MLPETAFSRLVDPWLSRIGRWTSLLWVLLLAVIVANVSLRYLFGDGRILFEELQWHLYSAGFLLGLSAAYQADVHVRVDVLHERLSARHRAWIELYGILLLLLPFIALILVFSIPFVAHSFRLDEVSQAPGGLPMRWVIKAMLPIAFGLLLIAALSRLTRVWAFLFSAPASGADRDLPHGR